MGNSHKNLLLRNHWANYNQTLVEWSLDAPLPKLCLVFPTSNQDGRQAKNRKKAGMKLKKNLHFWNYWANLNQTLLKWSLGGAKFGCGGHLDRRAEPPDTFLEENHPMTFIKILFLLSKWFQTRRFLWEFPIGSYVKLSSAVVAILVGGMKCRSQFWKRTTQGSFQQMLVEIGSVVLPYGKFT
jgi:hypothetical protein